ncbi:MAG: helix-turn-helix domain-containing protein [Candidatus Micrarchaeia archaeon]|jgi:hypothetical protein
MAVKKSPTSMVAAISAQGTAPAQKGRPRALTDPEIAEAQKLYWEECMPVRAIADALAVSHMTIWRAVCVPPPLAQGEGN